MGWFNWKFDELYTWISLDLNDCIEKGKFGEKTFGRLNKAGVTMG